MRLNTGMYMYDRLSTRVSDQLLSKEKGFQCAKMDETWGWSNPEEGVLSDRNM